MRALMSTKCFYAPVLDISCRIRPFHDLAPNFLVSGGTIPVSLKNSSISALYLATLAKASTVYDLLRSALLLGLTNRLPYPY